MSSTAIERADIQSESRIGTLIRWADHIADSPLLPDAYRRQSANIVIAAMLGEGMGLTWAQSLYRINVIKGKPTASAELIASNVRRAGHRLRVQSSNERAVVSIVRRDDPEFVFEVVWTIDDARRAGLLAKDNWQNYARSMLKARAITECAREACPEALYGVVYDEQELDDEPARISSETSSQQITPDTASRDVEATDDSHSTRAVTLTPDAFKPSDDVRRGASSAEDVTSGSTMSREAAAIDSPDRAVATSDEQTTRKRPLSDSQRRAMFRLFNTIDLFDGDGRTGKGREQRLAFISGAIGRQISSTNDLTSDEAGVVIELLEAHESQALLPIDEG